MDEPTSPVPSEPTDPTRPPELPIPAAPASDAATDAPSRSGADAVPAESTADLWAFTFADPLLAQEALLAAVRLSSHDQLELEDAAIVSRDDRGKVRLAQTRELTPGQGALSGGWFGLIAGLFVPGGPLVPMAIGAAAGGLFAKLRDQGIRDDEMRQWGESLDNGQAALFLLVAHCHQARVLHEVARFQATLLVTTGDDELAAMVRDRLAVDPWGLV